MPCSEDGGKRAPTSSTTSGRALFLPNRHLLIAYHVLAALGRPRSWSESDFVKLAPRQRPSTSIGASPPVYVAMFLNRTLDASSTRASRPPVQHHSRHDLLADMSSPESPPTPSSVLTKTILSAPANGVSQELRMHMYNVTEGLSSIESFGKAILKDLRVIEMSLLGKEEEPGKLEAKMVFETTVVDSASLPSVSLPFVSTYSRTGMLNDGTSMHGGCTSFLIDLYVVSIDGSVGISHPQRTAARVSRSPSS